jgi:hypothetical protein
MRFEPHFIIGGEDDPYLLRYYVLPRNHFLNIYLHKFMRSDDDRALHDHPWPFLSWIIKGEYQEHTPSRHEQDCAMTRITQRKRWSIAYRPAKWAHRVELYRELYEVARNDHTPHGGPLVRYWGSREKPVWTLILTGPKVREWGFFCKDGWRHWEHFVEAGCE